MRKSATIFDESPALTITALLRSGYLKQHQYKTGGLKWLLMGQECASVHIMANTKDDNNFIQLDYECEGNAVRQRIQLTHIPSNVGNGRLTYFLCPETGKRCNVLRLIDGKFVHKSFCNGMFRMQTLSRKQRELVREGMAIRKKDKALYAVYKPYFKETYAGNQTRRYNKLLRILGGDW